MLPKNLKRNIEFSFKKKQNHTKIKWIANTINNCNKDIHIQVLQAIKSNDITIDIVKETKLCILWLSLIIGLPSFDEDRGRSQ